MDVDAGEAALHEPAPARAGTAVRTGAHLLLGLLVLTLSTLVAGHAYGFAVAASQP